MEGESIAKDPELLEFEAFNPYHVSEKCIAAIGEQSGFSTLTTDVKQVLSEDVTYRIRELIHNSSLFLHYKTLQKLTNKHVNRALSWSSTFPIHGFSSTTPLKFNYSKDVGAYYYSENAACLYDIALEEIDIKTNSISTVEGRWVCMEGVAPASQSLWDGLNNDLDAVSLDYYTAIIESIFGNNEEPQQAALCDISSNHNIAEVFPFFINFMSSVISDSSGCLVTQMKVLKMINAFLENQHLSIVSTSYIETLSSTLLYSIVNIQDQKRLTENHFAVLKLAAFGLAQLLKSPAAVFHPQIREYSLNTLICSITLPSSTLATLFGVFVLFQMLDPIDTILALWPVLNQLEKLLLGRKAKMESKNTPDKIMFLNVLDAIKLCFCKVLKKFVKELTDEENNKMDSHPALISDELNAYLVMLRIESDSGFSAEHDRDQFSFINWYNVVYSICGESVLLDIPFTHLTAAPPLPCANIKSEHCRNDKKKKKANCERPRRKQPRTILSVFDVFDYNPAVQDRPFFKFNFVGAMPVPVNKLKYKSVSSKVTCKSVTDGCRGQVHVGKILNLLLPERAKWSKASASCSIFVNL